MDDSRPRSRFDPRLGDEGSEDEIPPPPPSPRRRSRKHVTLSTHPTIEEGQASTYVGSPDSENAPSEKLAEEEKDKRSLGRKILDKSPVDLKWTVENFTWSKIKPVIRCAITAWISVLFFIIPKLEVMLGQASFLILVAVFLMPPNQPFIAVFEQEITLMLFVNLAWAWSCLGLFLANLTRDHIDYGATFDTIITGQYIEAGPAVIQAVFLFFGSAFFLYLKARLGPGPFLVPTILACICLDVCLCTAALFPFPYYDIGKAVVVPLAFHSAFSVFFAAIIFPSTITAQYTTAIGRVLDPLHSALAGHRKILQLDPSSEEFAAQVKVLQDTVNKSEGALGPSAVWLRLLPRDIVWGRFSPSDVSSIQYWVRRIVTRAEGMNIYFTLIEPTREKFPVTPAPTVPNTPTRGNTPVSSRASSPVRGQRRERSTDLFQYPTRTTTRDSTGARHRGRHSTPIKSPLHAAIARHFPHLSGRHHRHSHRSGHDSHLHFSLLELAHTLAVAPDAESAVGVFESQRYLALEATRLSHSQSPELTARFTGLLSESCDELLEGCQKGLTSIKGWLTCVRRADFGGKKKVERLRADRLKGLEEVHEELSQIIDRFRQDKRLRVLDPYRCAFDPKYIGEKSGAHEAPPHKYLFHSYVYEYHALQIAVLVNGALAEIIVLENERKKAKLWVPGLLTMLWFWPNVSIGTEDIDREDDEDPDVVQLMDAPLDPDLGMTKRRDPDALPPSNKFESAMFWAHKGFAALGHGNAVFAIKAALLTVVLSIPYRIKSAAEFAYAQHFVWGIFIGQLTLARFRGDTTFGLVARIIATFFGGLVGTAIWYISTGNGQGDVYGLAAVCGVVFPFFFYARLYWPGPPVSNLIFFVTAVLVIGFSWQDTHFPSGFPYHGIDVAWRRFVLVTAGVTAAFLASFLPPSTTLRAYQRRMMSTTVAEIGSVYCSVVSFANTQGSFEMDRSAIVQSLIAIRLKLKRSLVLRTNIVYEFSLRGRWPAKRYQKILEIQLQIAYLLSHLMSVVEHLEPAWRRAFLRRTRLLDADFQGDVLAVISMISTALKTGQPLPQITPCPLLDRYMENSHGLNVIRHEADDDYGLPRTMTIDTLANEQYLCFSVGCTTAFGIVMRLDRLMLATKELVGEQYHIHGVGVHPSFTVPPTPTMSRPAKDA